MGSREGVNFHYIIVHFSYVVNDRMKSRNCYAIVLCRVKTLLKQSIRPSKSVGFVPTSLYYLFEKFISTRSNIAFFAPKLHFWRQNIIPGSLEYRVFCDSLIYCVFGAKLLFLVRSNIAFLATRSYIAFCAPKT